MVKVYFTINDRLIVHSHIPYISFVALYCASLKHKFSSFKLSETVKNAPRVLLWCWNFYCPHHLVCVHHCSVLSSSTMSNSLLLFKLYPTIKVWWAPLNLSLFLTELKLSDRESDSMTFSLVVLQKCQVTAPLTPIQTWVELWSPTQGVGRYSLPCTLTEEQGVFQTSLVDFLGL